jgi:hypothetical protein
MSDLAAWLLDRIAEDEAAARASGGEWSNGLPATIHPDPTVYRTVVAGPRHVCGSILAADAEHIARWDPARVLTECDAKRRIIALGDKDSDWSDVLALLALPYADAPGWREEWRP